MKSKLVNLPDSLAERLRRIAAEQEVSETEIVRRGLAKELTAIDEERAGRKRSAEEARAKKQAPILSTRPSRGLGIVEVREPPRPSPPPSEFPHPQVVVVQSPASGSASASVASGKSVDDLVALLAAYTASLVDHFDLVRAAQVAEDAIKAYASDPAEQDRLANALTEKIAKLRRVDPEETDSTFAWLKKSVFGT